jgi:outer membrane protein assembly factor BamA
LTGCSSERRPRPRLGRVFLAALFAFACGAGPSAGQKLVTAVEIQGGSLSDDPELRHGIGTHADAPYDASVLAKDLERIARFYRAHGYYDAEISAARVVSSGKDRVRVEIAVEPRLPVVVQRASVGGLETLPAKLARRVQGARKLRIGSPLVESRLHQDARDMETTLADAGYAFVRVDERATVSVARRAATVEYRVSPGPPAVFGEIRIEGLEHFDRRVVEAKLELTPGARYSRQALDLARQRLFDLGVFSSVDVTAALDQPETGRVPVRVRVHEGATHSVHVGATFETDNVRAIGGVRFGWESRNFLGGLRKLAFEVTPAVALYPLQANATLYVLPTVATALQLEQPAIFDARTTGFLRSELNVYPVLFSDYIPGENIVGFRELKDAAGVDRPLGNRLLEGRLSYNFQALFPFMYLGALPEGLDTIVVFYPELVLTLDLRDDPIEPRSGAFFGLTTQVAGLLAGNAKDARLQPEARLYAKLGPAATLGWRGTLGLLFPDRCGNAPSRGCYGDSLRQSAANTTSSALTRDQQILLFRGFYSGGATSNRGYALREVGPHGVLGYLSPSTVNCAVANPPDECNRPLGGLTLWELSLELRVTLSKLTGVVFFVDASDLTREEVSFRLNYPHLSTGSGFRLRTPIGAVRLDVGLRVPYMQEVGQRHLPPEEGEPATFFGAPIAVHFGLGEAF